MKSLSETVLHWETAPNANENEQLEELIREDDHVIVVLDDDPTGVQTVHDVSVYTQWDYETMCAALKEPDKLFYILTNSRGLLASESARIHHEIVSNVYAAAEKYGKKPMFISRSDSTLRGHYPLETDIIREEMERFTGQPIDGEILFPFFKEGGRYTINSEHYVLYGDELVPAVETEFAKDATFGYHSSYLPDYIAEKTNGEYASEAVVRITLSQLRAHDISSIEALLSVRNGFHRYCVDALDYSDVLVFCIALYKSMKKGCRFVFRSAASFVKVVGGVQDQPLLSFHNDGKSSNGGLIIVGSHTDKTTKQLKKLLSLSMTVGIPLKAKAVLAGKEALEKEVYSCVSQETEAIRNGKIAVCYTERDLISRPDDTKEEALTRAVMISQGVQMLVSELKIEPSFIVAKGGITSSDIGTKALKVKKAKVLGQIIPGVPVWELGEESRFPSIPYVIFPGNVGNEDSLYEVAQRLYGIE